MIYIIIFILLFFRPRYFIPKGIRNYLKEINALSVSRMVKRLIVNIAEWVVEANSIEALNSDWETLEEERRLTRIISDPSKSLAQSRNEFQTDLIYRTKGLKSDWEEMVSATYYYYYYCYYFVIENRIKMR